MSTAGSRPSCCSSASPRRADGAGQGVTAGPRPRGCCNTAAEDGSNLGRGAAACEAGIVTGSHSVLVVDDQAPYRMAANAVLRRLEGFEMVGAAASGPEAIALVDALRPALVLMDIIMPVMSGNEATR